jgi:hypothetical protein
MNMNLNQHNGRGPCRHNQTTMAERSMNRDASLHDRWNAPADERRPAKPRFRPYDTGIRVERSGKQYQGALATIRRNASGIRPPVRSRPDLIDPETAWYRDWYFMTRLEDEVQRSVEFGLQLALVVIRWTPLSESTPKSVSAFLSMRLALARDDLRVSDVPGRLSESEFAVYLPHSGARAAEALITLLREAFRGLSLSFGMAVCPSDAVTAAGLLEAGRRSADHVSSKVVDLEAYRQRRLTRRQA